MLSDFRLVAFDLRAERAGAQRMMSTDCLPKTQVPA